MSRKRQNYSDSDLEKAVNSVINKELSIRQSSALYSVPVSTLGKKVKNGETRKKKLGSPSRFSEDQEAEIAAWVVNRCKMGKQFYIHIVLL